MDTTTRAGRAEQRKRIDEAAARATAARATRKADAGRTVERIEGAGGARCSVCDSSLNYSWFVKFDDGSHAYRCSTHLPADPAAKPTEAGYPDLEPGELDAIEAEDRRRAARVARA